MTLRRLAPIAAVLAALDPPQTGCVATAVGAAAGTAIGVTGAAVGGAAKLGGHAVTATGRAITPGHGVKDDK
jgi:hypothetical protein